MTEPIYQSRIGNVLKSLKEENRAAFIPFIMAGDPDYDRSLALLKALPEAGADIIELGVCFTDPMADGPTIQAAGLRALASGQTLERTLDMVAAFRLENQTTPIVLMGYYNPFFTYGVQKFLIRAQQVGVDGLIIVDLPPEEDEEMCLPAQEAGIDFIRLITPTTNNERLPSVIRHSSGFVYYVSVAGVTGQKTAGQGGIDIALENLRDHTDLPVAVGFGIKTKERASEIAKVADAVVVGSALVEKIERTYNERENGVGRGQPLETLDKDPQYRTEKIVQFAKELADGVHNSRNN